LSATSFISKLRVMVAAMHRTTLLLLLPGRYAPYLTSPTIASLLLVAAIARTLQGLPLLLPLVLLQKQQLFAAALASLNLQLTCQSTAVTAAAAASGVLRCIVWRAAASSSSTANGPGHPT
jgi:hypothetical protein